MPFTVDVRDDGAPVAWSTDGDGVVAREAPDYEPALYVAARNDRERHLDWVVDALAGDPKVVALTRERWFRSLDASERSPMVRVAVDRLGDVRQVARELRARAIDAHAPGVLALYDVDLDPQFRFCLDTGRDPVPGRELRTLSLSLPDPALAADDVGALAIDGDRVAAEDGGRAGARASDGGASASDERVRAAVERALERVDPDVLVVSSADIVPLLAEVGVDLGRRPGYRRLAGESTYVSYGRVGHSPARFDVPGRAIVDRSNSFLLGHSSMAGLLYFVARAGKPLQEIARDSIGGVLTSLEIRKARERGVLAPWQKRQTERWKTVDELHDADRGGFSFQPDVGVHEDVHQLDFASLYPNVIREYDVSPETVCCDCHDRADVPELGYSVCDRDAFLGDVLGDLLDDRAAWKAELAARRRADGTDDSDGGGGIGGGGTDSDAAGRAGGGGEDSTAASGTALAGDVAATPTSVLEAKSEAVKWVLVSCFGYQGYRHAKFGRIETHEAINAYARQIMLDAKAALEDAGWRVRHGIVDSVWVTAAPDREQTPIREVAREISDAVEIDLEYEGRFDWVAFCPRKRASGGAVMRYFGRWAADSIGGGDGADAFKLRGIEARQRSTCAFVADAQRELLAVFDRERAPEPVCDRLAGILNTLRGGGVPREELVVTQRVSKRASAYRQATRAKHALERAADRGVDRRPGQDVAYVVVDDDRAGPERVRLAFELDAAGDSDGPPDDDGRSASGSQLDAGGASGAGGEHPGYDAEFYADRLVRACESVLAPLGWDETRIRRYLSGVRDASLASYG
jgi:DNA polymerase I